MVVWRKGGLRSRNDARKTGLLLKHSERVKGLIIVQAF